MGFKLCTPTRAFASTNSVCHSDHNTHFTDVQGGIYTVSQRKLYFQHVHVAIQKSKQIANFT